MHNVTAALRVNGPGSQQSSAVQVGKRSAEQVGEDDGNRVGLTDGESDGVALVVGTDVGFAVGEFVLLPPVVELAQASSEQHVPQQVVGQL